MKNRLLAAFFAGAAFIGLVYAGFTQLDTLRLADNNIQDSDATDRLFVGDPNIFNGPIAHGNTNSLTSITLPTATTGADFGHWVPVYNPTSSSISAGTVLVSSDTGLGYVEGGGATTDLTTIIGVAAADISATSNGWMVPRGGGYAVALTTGTVTEGQTLVSTTSAAGRLTGDSTPTTGADVAIALEDGTSSGDSILVIMK